MPVSRGAVIGLVILVATPIVFLARGALVGDADVDMSPDCSTLSNPADCRPATNLTDESGNVGDPETEQPSEQQIAMAVADYIEQRLPAGDAEQIIKYAPRDEPLAGLIVSALSGNPARSPASDRIDPENLNQEETFAEIGRQLQNYFFPDQALPELPRDGEQRLRDTLHDWGGGMTLKDAAKKNWVDQEPPAVATATPSSDTSQVRSEFGPQHENQGESGDPNMDIGRNGPDDMEASTEAQQEAERMTRDTGDEIEKAARDQEQHDGADDDDDPDHPDG